MNLDMDHLREVEHAVRERIALARKLTLSFSAEMFEHYLDGKGETKQVNSDILRLNRAFRGAEERLFERFGLAFAFQITELMNRGSGTMWITRAYESKSHVGDSTEELRQPVSPHMISDLYWASGGSTIHGRPRIHVDIRKGQIEVDGYVDFLWRDRYQWNLKEESKKIPVDRISMFTPGKSFTIEDLDALRVARMAREFDMESRWSVQVKASIDFEHIVGELARADTAAFYRWESVLDHAARYTDMNVTIGRKNFQGTAADLFQWLRD
jgi:hypothetical protein